MRLHFLTKRLVRRSRLPVSVALFSTVMLGQTTSHLRTQVLKPDHSPLSGARVELLANENVVATCVTTADGTCEFSDLPAGSYRLHASDGERQGQSELFVLKATDLQQVKVVLRSKSALEEAPGYFDQPSFTVAGVTDTTNLGGHGSDTVVRTRETAAADLRGLTQDRTATNFPKIDELRHAADVNPGDFRANHEAGEALAKAGRVNDAVLYFRRAHELQPGDFSNEFLLARALADSGDTTSARSIANALLQKQRDRAELHRLLGQIEEQEGRPSQAAAEFQRAASMDPSEQNLLEWGAELLKHHAPGPALDVFEKGVQRYPNSVPMVTGLGVSWYAKGSYEQAEEALCHAAELGPTDPVPITILGDILTGENSSSQRIQQVFERYLTLRPDDPGANYYVALSLWKSERSQQQVRIQSLLDHALQKDPRFAPAALLRGIVLQERREFEAALTAFQRAAELDPTSTEPHFRMAEIYRLQGEGTKERNELSKYQELRAASELEIERKRHIVQQFVFHTQSPGHVVSRQ